MPGLAVRKLADRSEGERVPGFHPRTGEKTLINPATDRVEPWPLLGVMIEGEAPAACRVPTSFVARGRHEGWIAGEGERVAHAAGGPPEDPWRVTHTFIELDAVVLKTVEGDVRYRVVHNPGKYPDGEGARVDWFYDLELEA